MSARSQRLAEAPLEAREREAGLELARSSRVAVFVVAYDAESHIEATLKRIPSELVPLLADLYVIDDSSRDRTCEAASRLAGDLPPLKVFRTPFNQGYGGNQKLGYSYAIRQGYDFVVLLHGDGQYAPEALTRMLAPFRDDSVDAVFGSRMLVKGAARRGGMPLYKRLGNRVLSWLENRLLGTRLSEFHSGYRAYRMATLERLPFRLNTNDFHFDTEIIIQLVLSGARIVEVPIPSYYGDEICHVNGIKYAVNCIRTILAARLNDVHLLYHPKYDVRPGSDAYVFKEAPTSLHQHVLGLDLESRGPVVELGAAHGELSERLVERGARVVAVDSRRPARHFAFPYLECDLDQGFAEAVTAAAGGPADLAIALDVIEHTMHPERVCREIHRLLRPGGRLLASMGNVAFVVPRLALALGQFNYGKKGILDLTHRRLFTLSSFARLLEGEGFRIERARGFGPPIADLVGSNRSWRQLDRVASALARCFPRLFGYQFLIEATRLDSVEDLMTETVARRQDHQALDSVPAGERDA